MVDFDKVLDRIGHFGRYQGLLYVMACFPILLNGMHFLAVVFVGDTPEHYCRVPGDVQPANMDRMYGTDGWYGIMNQTIPMEKSDDGNMVYSQCDRYSSPGNRTSKVRCDGGWVYSKDQYESTVVMTWDLVCDRKWMSRLNQAIFMLGVMSGAVVFGNLADRFGRRKIFIVCMVGECLSGIVNAFLPNYAAWLLFRFLVGFTSNGSYVVAFSYVMEIVGATRRTICGIFVQMWFAGGIMLLSLLAYFIREWHMLQLTMTLPSLIVIGYWWFLPESPRWLLAQGQTEEAGELISRYAEKNGVQLEPGFINEAIELHEPTAKKSEDQHSHRNYGLLDLVRTPNLRKRTLNVCFNWFVNSLVYYGLSLNTSNLGGDDYVNSFTSGAVELPAYVVTVILMERIGRQKTLSTAMVIGGVGCFCTVAVPLSRTDLIPVRTTLAMIGKFGISISFAVIYNYTAELYPTVIRSVAVGVGSMSARIAGIIAPFAIMIGDLWSPLPLIIFGAMSLVAGALALLLPDTTGKPLMQTIEEAEQLGKKTPANEENGKLDGVPDITYQ
ncbi:hypothetical protein Bbelb_326310 [Branchiostoma belcheri]|nr:hypothetical protein Bbelb_326310 [Branchiostoma belcheri]